MTSVESMSLADSFVIPKEQIEPVVVTAENVDTLDYGPISEPPD